MKENGFFERMCKEAMDELASGEKGWKDCDTNTLFLASFGMMCSHLSRKLGRPLWFFSSAIGVGVIGYLIHLVLG